MQVHENLALDPAAGKMPAVPGGEEAHFSALPFRRIFGFA
jgi:hypothetical protein